MGLPAADGGAEEAFVEGVGDGLRVDGEAAFSKPGGFLFARPVEVADGGVDGQLGGEGADGDVEADLVVAGAGGAVGDGVGSELAGDVDDGFCLGGAFGADGDGVGATAKDVAFDEVADEAVVDNVLGVDDAMFADT